LFLRILSIYDVNTNYSATWRVVVTREDVAKRQKTSHKAATAAESQSACSPGTLGPVTNPRHHAAGLEVRRQGGPKEVNYGRPSVLVARWSSVRKFESSCGRRSTGWATSSGSRHGTANGGMSSPPATGVKIGPVELLERMKMELTNFINLAT